ncbi:MAG TPA: tyrosine-type recombinase/integrase, partial [Acidobacteriaceae bacterium]|nr:tyrosine-type recombinase/integrase [Acidobacteriaceae bacterium]
MKLSVAYLPSTRNSASPYRLLDELGQEVDWANRFLDTKRLLSRSPRSLRAYAFDLLHFARWAQHPPRRLADLTEDVLQEYVRHQLDRQPPPATPTINRRLGVVRALYRFHFQSDIPGSERFPRTYFTRSPLGYGRPGRAISYGLRLTQPRRIIMPLSADEVARFWRSFRHYRDLALVGLMLLDGMRSCEVLALQLADLRLAEAHILVRGKGNKPRLLPLPQDILQTLKLYLSIERPLTNASSLFVCLKGRSRGLPLTSAGLRSLFRHHRATTHIPQANPHRFRHTFGADMVR